MTDKRTGSHDLRLGVGKCVVVTKTRIGRRTALAELEL